MDRRESGPSPQSAGWLYGCFAHDSQLVGRVVGSMGDWSPDACLLARRMLESGLGLSPEDAISEYAYRSVAAALSADNPPAARALDAIAGTQQELDVVSQLWTRRYLRRPLLQEQSEALRLMIGGCLSEQGSVIWGIDGASYKAADVVSRQGGQTVPAVTVHAPGTGGRGVVTGFSTPAARDTWLADRGQEAEGPLLAVADDGPRCRAVREETALAWLLQEAAVPQVAARLRPDMLTTDVRSEIFHAWRAAALRPAGFSMESCAAELRSRMLRAPGWAAGRIGWPEGHIAARYLARLARTPVTGGQGHTAISALAEEEASAAAATRRKIPVPKAMPSRAEPAIRDIAQPPTALGDFGPRTARLQGK